MCKVSMSNIIANNPYMEEGYDETQLHKYAMYLDANNLYGHAMVQNLPYDGYEWNNKFIEQDVEQTIEYINNAISKGLQLVTV